MKYWRYNVNEPWKHNAKHKKLDIKGHIVYDAISIKCPDMQTQKRKID